MIERALNQGWDVAPDQQRKSIELAIDTLGIPASTQRERQAAVRVLVALIRHDGSTDAEIRKRAQDALRKYSQGDSANER